MCITLRPSSLFMGSEVKLGSFDVMVVKSRFSLKSLTVSCNTVYSRNRYIYMQKVESFFLIGSTDNPGSFGVKILSYNYKTKLTCSTWAYMLMPTVTSSSDIGLGVKGQKRNYSYRQGTSSLTTTCLVCLFVFVLLCGLFFVLFYFLFVCFLIIMR